MKRRSVKASGKGENVQGHAPSRAGDRGEIEVTRRSFLIMGGVLLGLLPLMQRAFAAGLTRRTMTGPEKIRVFSVAGGEYVTVDRVIRSDTEWQRTLTAEQHRVLREKGTERAYTGRYWNHYGKGTYRCAGCGNDLFSSAAKFDSKTGWPSFWEPVAAQNVATEDDYSLFGIRRVEVLCSRCGGHLGHVFEDGPPPTGLRYCINSAALVFVPRSAPDGTGRSGSLTPPG